MRLDLNLWISKVYENKNSIVICVYFILSIGALLLIIVVWRNIFLKNEQKKTSLRNCYTLKKQWSLDMISKYERKYSKHNFFVLEDQMKPISEESWFFVVSLLSRSSIIKRYDTQQKNRGVVNIRYKSILYKMWWRNFNNTIVRSLLMWRQHLYKIQKTRWNLPW